jgi:hypothetical protein
MQAIGNEIPFARRHFFESRWRKIVALLWLWVLLVLHVTMVTPGKAPKAHWRHTKSQKSREPFLSPQQRIMTQTVLLKGFPVWELNGSPLYNEIRRAVKARYGDGKNEKFRLYLKPKSKGSLVPLVTGRFP